MTCESLSDLQYSGCRSRFPVVGSAETHIPCDATYCICHIQRILARHLLSLHIEHSRSGPEFGITKIVLSDRGKIPQKARQSHRIRDKPPIQVHLIHLKEITRGKQKAQKSENKRIKPEDTCKPLAVFASKSVVGDCFG